MTVNAPVNAFIINSLAQKPKKGNNENFCKIKVQLYEIETWDLAPLAVNLFQSIILANLN